MKQTTSTKAPDTMEEINSEKHPQKMTMEILIVRMMKTYKNLQAYHRGEITLDELHELGIKLG